MTRLLPLIAATVLAFLSAAQAQEKPLVLDVWPGKAPGETGAVGAEKWVESKKPEKNPVTRLTNISKPTISVFRPTKAKDTGAAVVIAPGGGYNILAWNLEGEEVAAWLNTIGVTGIVLKYRVPRRPDDPKDGAPLGALQDAQRAMSLVRSKAGAWGIDAKRIGMLGFSAGGHLTAFASTNFDKRRYEPIDSIDQVSCRPDFAVLLYPGMVVEKGNAKLRPDIRVTKDTPPMFFAHASNDGVSSENSVALYLALKQAKVPAEMHLYATGGHGFGLRPSAEPCSTWPQRCAEWMNNQGILKINPSR
jgi:acetyl esterase/lipase